MRRERRNQRKIDNSIIISIICAILILIAIIVYTIRNYIVKDNSKDLALNDNKEISILENDDYEDASTDIGKTVEESKKENNDTTNNITNTVQNQNTSKQNTKLNTTINTTSNATKSENETNKDKEEKKEDIKFEAPVKGEIIREFAQDSLVYSETLQEWITHNGVDIKADKTTVVTASASGIVYAIKNDPRYGLTIIINHDNGYQSVYSNLLTSEFVVEGENVEQGQTLGTIGTTASFEISDDYHLHFELLKDNKYVDPTIYMNFE